MDEMSVQVRGIIFFLLVLVVIFAWSHFYSPPVPPIQKPVPTASQQPAPSQASASQPVSSSKSAAQQVPEKIQAVQASAERTVAIDSSLYHVELSNRGGVVRSWRLKNYFDDQKPPHPLELVDPDGAQQLGWPF